MFRVHSDRGLGCQQVSLWREGNTLIRAVCRSSLITYCMYVSLHAYIHACTHVCTLIQRSCGHSQCQQGHNYCRLNCACHYKRSIHHACCMPGIAINVTATPHVQTDCIHCMQLLRIGAAHVLISSARNSVASLHSQLSCRSHRQLNRRHWYNSCNRRNHHQHHQHHLLLLHHHHRHHHHHHQNHEVHNTGCPNPALRPGMKL